MAGCFGNVVCVVRVVARGRTCLWRLVACGVGAGVIYVELGLEWNGESGGANNGNLVGLCMGAMTKKQ